VVCVQPVCGVPLSTCGRVWLRGSTKPSTGGQGVVWGYLGCLLVGGVLSVFGLVVFFSAGFWVWVFSGLLNPILRSSVVVHPEVSAAL